MRTTIWRHIVGWVFVADLITLTALADSATLGFSIAWSDGRYMCSGGSAPWAIELALLNAVLYMGLMMAGAFRVGGPVSGVMRRFGAFWIDVTLVIVTLGPIVGLLPLLVEWRRTGVFAWGFTRETFYVTDPLVVGINSVLALISLLAWFVIPLSVGKPTPGGLVTGYAVRPLLGVLLTKRKAVYRALLGVVALTTWPVTLFVFRRREMGQLWPDRMFGTQAIRIE